VVSCWHFATAKAANSATSSIDGKEIVTIDSSGLRVNGVINPTPMHGAAPLPAGSGVAPPEKQPLKH
jgi:hypothetical protein